MGAIAVSVEDERKIQKLGKRLGITSKSGVVRLAVDELERRLDREQLGIAICDYVRKYGNLDKEENAELAGAGVARSEE